jgi:hypothetical protein
MRSEERPPEEESEELMDLVQQMVDHFKAAGFPGLVYATIGAGGERLIIEADVEDVEAWIIGGGN